MNTPTTAAQPAIATAWLTALAIAATACGGPPQPLERDWSRVAGLADWRTDHGARVAVGPGSVATVAGSRNLPFIQGVRPYRDDIFVVQFDAEGNELWRDSFGSDGWDDVRYLMMDGSGGVYLVGMTQGSGIDGQAPLSDPADLENAGDILVTRYDSGGNRVWTRLLGTAGSDLVVDAVLAPGGGVIVRALFGGSAPADNGVFMIKLDPAGNIVWQRRWSAMIFFAGRMVVDASGNMTTAPIFAAESFPLEQRSAAGEPLWLREFSGNVPMPHELASDADDNIYLHVTAAALALDGESLFSGSDVADCIFKFASDGALLWWTQGVTPPDFRSNGLAVRADGTLVGFLRSADFSDELHRRRWMRIYDPTNGAVLAEYEITAGDVAEGMMSFALNPAGDAVYVAGTVTGGVYDQPAQGAKDAVVSRYALP